MVSPRARIVSSRDGDETRGGKQKISSVMAVWRRMALSTER
jgi:hypothetical protein